MISKVSPVTSASHKCIDTLIEYLTHGHKDELKDQKERVSDFFTMNLEADDLETATEIMMYYASLNTRSSKSKYMHLVLSLPENEKLDQATWKNIVSDYLDAVGMTGHQCIAVQHEDNGKQHYHLVINRIDTNTHARVNDYLLYKKLQRFDEQIEKKYKLNQFEHVKTFENKSERVARDIEKKSEHQSFISYLLLHKEEITNSKSWNELFANLKKLNCTIAVKGRGLIIKSLSNKDYAIKASTFDRSFSYAKLIKKFGYYDFEKSYSNSSETTQQPEAPKTEYKQEPVTKNAKRIEYSQYFFKRILERHDDVVDKGNRLLVHKAKSYKTYQDILKIAKRRFGDGKIVATGSNDFQRRLMYHAIKMNIKVKFSDLKVQQEYERQLAKQKYKKAQIAKLHREEQAMRIRQEQMERLNEQTRRAELKQRARSQETKRAAQETQQRTFHR